MSSDHSPMNQSIAENFMRSAKAPQISAGVMIANVIWKAMYTDSGIVVARWLTMILPASFWKTIPSRNSRSMLPKNCPPGMNAML